MTRRVAIVPHTHWDREWYEPYQSFRMRLVEMLDALVPILEKDPSYARFLLDGQMAVVDDYLEVRPEAESRLRALAATGRLVMGPWYILMDEFLVSGETIVRNLQLGFTRGAAFGGVMEVGYLPDMFGHIAQMPQILHLAGFEHAVVWRGVPSAVEKSAFNWEAPDGSRVRAEYLMTGYGNGAAIGDDAKALVRRIADHIDEVGSFLLDGLLFMNGTDHQEPQSWLGRVVAEANDIQDDFEIEITSLPEYLAGAPSEGLTTWKGELRSGIRANVLMGVASNRVDVKRAAAITERELERRAEPYAALFAAAEKWPARLLELAWLGIVRNSAHDSICACSVDDVVDAVLYRFAESRTIAEGVAERALKSFSRSLELPGPFVVNPSARPRGGVVEAILPGAEAPAGTQLLAEPPGAFGIPRGLGAMSLDAKTVRMLIGLLPSGSQIDAHTWIQDIAVTEDETGIDITIEFGQEERFDVPIATIKQDVYTRLGARPDALVRVRIGQPAAVSVLARVAPVQGLGWARFQPTVAANPVSVADDAAQVVLSNGLVTVSVDKSDGTFAVDGRGGFGTLVDGGDLGDSYNYSPPRDDRFVSEPVSVSVSAPVTGPVEAQAVVVSNYVWPDHVDSMSQTRVGEQPVEVTTTLTLRADEAFVRVSTRFLNPSRDHRLRVHFPLPEPTDHSHAECAFAVVRRGLTAEGRSDELGIPTFPSRRFVSAGGLTVAHNGLLEYELVDMTGDAPAEDGSGADDAAGGAETKATGIAVTLLRSTGMLSRLGMSYRPLPAGPLTPVEGLQLVGEVIRADYAVQVGCTDPYALVDDAFLPLELVHSPGGGTRSEAGSMLRVEGAEVSAIRREAGALEVRVFNPTDEETTVTLGSRSGWIVDLRGRPMAPFEGGFSLRPFGIATLRVSEP
jgi:mannosylglycerate hydrolase